MRPGGGKRRARFVLPALYLLLAAYVWFDFATAPRDGLANVGLVVVTLPVTAVGLAIGSLMGVKEFVLMPDRYGYIADHALYYVPAVAITASLVWLIGRAIDRRPA